MKKIAHIRPPHAAYTLCFQELAWSTTPADDESELCQSCERQAKIRLEHSGKKLAVGKWLKRTL